MLLALDVACFVAGTRCFLGFEACRQIGDMESGKATPAPQGLIPGPSRAWSCDTLLRGSSFLADQQAKHAGKLKAQDAIAATW